jgi:hypothetical protein
MPYVITPHTGVNIATDDVTQDDLLLIHLDDGTFWVMSAKRLPVLRLDREFTPDDIRGWELSLEYLTTSERPDLRWWLHRMTRLVGSQHEHVYQRGAWPNVTHITSTTRQRLRALLSAHA